LSIGKVSDDEAAATIKVTALAPDKRLANIMTGMNTLQGRVLMPPTLSFAKGNMLRVANGLWRIDETRYAFVKYYSHLVG
jgi:hypothetical protein